MIGRVLKLMTSYYKEGEEVLAQNALNEQWYDAVITCVHYTEMPMLVAHPLLGIVEDAYMGYFYGIAVDSGKYHTIPRYLRKKYKPGNLDFLNDKEIENGPTRILDKSEA